jgi:hypothetical protein
MGVEVPDPHLRIRGDTHCNDGPEWARLHSRAQLAVLDAIRSSAAAGGCWTAAGKET